MRHASRKSPAQLDREIARALARKPRRSRSHAAITGDPDSPGDIAVTTTIATPRRPRKLSKPKLKWFREGESPYEDMYLIPVGQERSDDGSLNTDGAVGWVRIAYHPTRFYSGRGGGEGESRPDSYLAYIADLRPERRGRGILITEGADTTAHSGAWSASSPRAFTKLRAAKEAVTAALATR